MSNEYCCYPPVQEIPQVISKRGCYANAAAGEGCEIPCLVIGTLAGVAVRERLPNFRQGLVTHSLEARVLLLGGI